MYVGIGGSNALVKKWLVFNRYEYGGELDDSLGGWQAFALTVGNQAINFPAQVEVGRDRGIKHSAIHHPSQILCTSPSAHKF